MTLLYIVRIPKQDEEGEYLEDHYFKGSYNATLFAMKNEIQNFTSAKFNEGLAEELAED